MPMSYVILLQGVLTAALWPLVEVDLGGALSVVEPANRSKCPQTGLLQLKEAAGRQEGAQRVQIPYMIEEFYGSRIQRTYLYCGLGNISVLRTWDKKS